MKLSRTLIFLQLIFALAVLISFADPFSQSLSSRMSVKAAASPAELRRTADKRYDEKSYALALKAYRQWLKSTPANSPGRTEVAYRVAVALGKSQKWDEALAAWDTFLAAHQAEPLWTARGQYQRGLLLQQVPHLGYKVGTRTYRGEDYPHVADAETPEQVSLDQDDAKGTLQAFEAALKAYQQLMPSQPIHFTVHLYIGEARGSEPYIKIKSPAPPILAAEEADLYFDLAKFLPTVQGWGSKEDWQTAKSVDWAVQPDESYSPKWPMPKKVLCLYARIPMLNKADTHLAALAGMARALFVAQFHNSWALREPPYWKIVQTIPYDKLDAIQMMQQTADAYPRDPQAPQMRLIAAQWTQSKGNYIGALSLYRALVARYPSSQWAEDARAAIQEIRRESISLNTPGPQPVDKKASLDISSRNLKTLTLRAYRIPLEDVLTEEGKINNPDYHFTSFRGNFGDAKQARRLGAKVAEWTYTTKDKGDYAPVSETVPTPLYTAGAYLVVAGGDEGRVRGAAIVLISDLAVVKKTDKDRALCFVADAKSGRPVSGAKVVTRETYWENNKNHVQVSQGQTDADGIYDAPRVRRPDIYSAHVEVFAYAPGSRYALTNENGWSWYDENGGNRDEIKIYSYTDRPVYRPQQTVYFRELLAKRKGDGSDFAPLAGIPATVTVDNAKGEQIYQATLKSSEFGSVNGSFPLPSGAPLGEYTVAVSVPDALGQVNDEGGNRFRVEEYKKPEYEVKITPSATQARFGDKVTATVNATYYFGAPVAGAKVSYKVFRNPYYPNYRFPQPYDWFYHYDNGDYTNQNVDQGELVAQGEAVTDAEGNAAVVFRAEKGTRGYDGDYAYTIKADVVDASRRQISGEGVMHVTNQQFYAYLNIPNGFYHAGDIVQAELRTQDADQHPVAATGTLTVLRILGYDKNNQEQTEAVHMQTVTTDADGKAFTTWRTEVSGQYRVEFKAFDKFETPVVAQAPVWVEGDDLKDRTFRVGGVTLLTDQTTYQEGETAHLLIVADQPDDWVLLTQETGNQILKRSLVFVPGRARTVDVPIVRADVPNFALAAVAVRDYQFYSWQQELFVPPARQFVHMAVTGDKAEYRPGDMGIFHVKTTDYLGRPVASEVSLAVVDSSVFYIQKDYAPDIRLFYYGQRRDINVNADASLNFQVESRDESDFPQRQFKPHGIVLPEFGCLPGQYYNPYYYGMDGDLGVVRSVGGEGGFGGRVYTVNGAVAMDAAMPMSTYATPAPMMVKDDLAPAASPEVPPPTALPQTPPGQTPFAQARVRNYFPDTAFWTPAVVTSKTDGTATVKVKFPDSLTTWKATARGLTAGVQVGAADTDVITDKKLLVRLESPRFFVERDKVTLSAIVRNDLKTDKQVRVSLVMDGPLAPNNEGATTITVPAGSEKRVDWTTDVTGDGTAHIKMVAETDEESDAVEQSFPVLTYGVQKFVAQSGVLQSDQNMAKLTINVPAEHKPGSAALLIQVNPSLAATTLDALPYLADYPYGCVEQTLSRFLPSVLVAKTLRDAGVDLETLHKRALAMQEREQAGTPFGQAHETDGSTDQTAYTYPHGTPGVLKTPELAEGLPHGDRWNSPVFDPARLKDMTDEGLARLVSMQRSDGGWGWWPDSSESDPYMSAYVLYGLATAKSAGVTVPADVLSRGYAYLATDIKDRDDERDLAVWEAFALSQRGELPASARKIIPVIYDQRDKLSAYGQSLLALTLHNTGDDAKAAVVCRNMQDTATIDPENGTATWKIRHGDWWDWYNDDTETVAWALKAYVAVMPKSELTPMLVKWLVTSQRGSVWHSTKETAMAVYALTDYIRTNNELTPDYTVTVALGEKISRTFHITRDNALLFDNRFLVPDNFLPGGPEAITITKQGLGRLYYASALQYFTTEEQIKGVGGELKVQRRYFKLTPKTKQVADWEGGTFNALDYTRTELPDGASLNSGDLIEVELVLDSKNEYDYCVFEDMKPAGCEAIDLRSGEKYGDGLCSNMELRDTKVAFFVDHLPQGTRVLRYRLRAEVPGAFHALPTNAYAMYAPDVRALSDGWHVTVGDQTQVSRR